MSQAATVFIAALLSASAATGVQMYLQSGRDQPAWGTSAGETEAAVERLNNEVAELRKQLTQVPRVAEARQPVNKVSEAELAAAVAAYMKSQGSKAAAPAGAPARLLTPSQAFQQLVDKDMGDRDAEALWKRYREAGKEMELLKLFEQHAANSPTDPDAQTSLGNAYLQALQGKNPGPETGQLAMQADRSFDKALKLDPNHWSARFTKATALTFWPPMFGKTPEAISNLETLRKQQESGGAVKPHFAQTYLLLGNIYSQQGKVDKAKEAWQKGAGLFPDNQNLKQKLGQ